MGTAHLECHGIGVRVSQPEGLGDLMLEGTCAYSAPVACVITHPHSRLNPSSGGSNSTDMV
jgi:predicted metalloenzyme YecM